MSVCSLRRVAWTVLVALSAGSCGRSQPVRLYLLHPLAAEVGVAEVSSTSESGSAGAGSPVVSLHLAMLPRYLDRPQIVQRYENHRLKAAEYDRWAEPLTESVARILAENLAILLGTENVVVAPAKPAGTPDYHVSLEIFRFDVGQEAYLSTPAGADEGAALRPASVAAGSGQAKGSGKYAVLIGRWSLRRGDGAEVRPATRFGSAVAVGDDSYAAIARSLSETLTHFARTVADAIRKDRA